MSILEMTNLKTVAKKHGFVAVGNFLICSRSDDVIAGLALDKTPSTAYVWTFVLPAFDNLSFLHLSLGERISETGSHKFEEEVIKFHRENLSRIRTADDLYEYLEHKAFQGEYATWTRFLCLVRAGHLEKAASSLSRIGLSIRSPTIRDRLTEIKEAQQSGGWIAVQNLLNEWSLLTARLLPKVPSRL